MVSKKNFVIAIMCLFYITNLEVVILEC